MSQPPQTPPFAIVLANYPQVLLLGKYQYDLIFNAANYLSTPAKFKIIFKSDSLALSGHEGFASGIDFQNAETKQISIKAQPLIDGLARIDIEILGEKNIEYTEMVWKVRQKVEDALVKKILGEKLSPGIDLKGYRAQIPNKIDDGGFPALTAEMAKAKMLEIENSPQIPEEKNVEYINLSRAVFMQDPSIAFDLLERVNETQSKMNWILHYLPTSILLDHSLALSKVMDLPDTEKTSYFEMIAYAIAIINPQDAAMAAMNIEDGRKRDEILKNIIFGIAETKPDIASNIVYQINDTELQRKVLFEVIKNWGEKNKEQAVQALQSLIENILSGANSEFIKTCMIFLAHLTSPQSVYDLVDKFDATNKQTLIEQLQEFLKVQVEVKKTRVESVPVGSTFYTFPSAAQKASPSVEYLATLVGNISANLLSGKMSSNLIFICPFSYPFPIYMSFQQAYLEFEQQFAKSFGFVLYPSKSRFDGPEGQHFQTTLKEIIGSISQLPSPTQILVLDFIPYLSGATIILGSDSIAGAIKQKLARVLQNGVTFLEGSDMFSQGELLDNIKTILPEPKFNTAGIVLSYNFLNEYPLIKSFFQAMLS